MKPYHTLLIAIVASGAILIALGWIAFRFGRRGGATVSRWPTLCAATVVLSILVGGGVAVGTSNPLFPIFLGIPLMLVIVVCGSFAAGAARSPFFGIPRAAFTTAAWLAFPASVLWIWYMFAGPGYYAEFERIKAELAAIPQVEIVEMGGNRDVTYEDIWARLRVKDKGEITVMGLTPASLHESPNLHLARIGPFSFRRQRWGYHHVIDRDGKPVRSRSMGFTLDVGREGDFGSTGKLSGRWPVAQIRNVGDLVRRYDEVCAALQTLQKEPFFFREADGSTDEIFIRSGERS